MTVREALDAVGTLKPHAYGAEALLRELSRLDGRIMKELWQGRAGAAEELPNYTEVNAANTSLVAEEPYDLMYLHYLMARIALWNGEVERYNQYAQLFEEAYGAYRAWVSREALWLGGQKLRM